VRVLVPFVVQLELSMHLVLRRVGGPLEVGGNGASSSPLRGCRVLDVDGRYPLAQSAKGSIMACSGPSKTRRVGHLGLVGASSVPIICREVGEKL
jgi:hypothetical protein